MSIFSLIGPNLTNPNPGLSEAMVSRLHRQGVRHFFPVQRQIVPLLLASGGRTLPYRPSDMCVSAPTGSGKTLAFVVPIVESLRGRMVPKVIV